MVYFGKQHSTKRLGSEDGMIVGMEMVYNMDFENVTP